MDPLDSSCIISQVKQHPCLYDFNHEDYKNKLSRKTSWLQITKAVIGEQWDTLDEHAKSDFGQYLYNNSCLAQLGLQLFNYYNRLTVLMNHYPELL